MRGAPATDSSRPADWQSCPRSPATRGAWPTPWLYSAEAHPFFRDFGSPMLVALELLGFAATLDRAGQAEPAAKVLAAAEAHRERAGTAYPPFIERLTHRPTLESVREALDEEEFARVWEEGTPLSADEALALAQDAMR